MPADRGQSSQHLRETVIAMIEEGIAERGKVSVYWLQEEIKNRVRLNELVNKTYEVVPEGYGNGLENIAYGANRIIRDEVGRLFFDGTYQWLNAKEPGWIVRV
jgi:hypothetical protein